MSYFHFLLLWIILLWTFVLIFVWTCSSFLWGIYPGVELLGHMVTLCLIFWEIVKRYFKTASTLYSFLRCMKVQIPHISTISCYYLFCGDSQPSGYEIVFDFFLMVNNVEHLFMCRLFVYFPWRITVWICAHLKKLIYLSFH